MKHKKNKNYSFNFAATIAKKPERSKTDHSHKHITTQNAGDLMPILCKEIIPGDLINIKIKALIRQTTLIKPTMDTAYIDIAVFFVRNQTIWDDWKKFMGENEDPWAPKERPTIPQVTAPDIGWQTGTVADILKIKLNTPKISVSKLQFNAVAKIVNDWYRDENLQNSYLIDTTSSDIEGSNGNTYNDLARGGKIPKSNKYHDYFTSALPSPQKGEAIKIGITTDQDLEVHAIKNKRVTNTENDDTLRFDNMGLAQNAAAIIEKTDENFSNALRAGQSGTGGTAGSGILSPNNLFAHIKQEQAITINELRSAIAAQQILEADARGGTRYVEKLKAQWGVTSPDATQQRAEYLGGTHTALSIQQVEQTASTNETTPQANLAAYGQSGIESPKITKAFTEHGFLIVMATIRYEHSYQQGIPKQYLRKTELDFYNPILANVGEQPIKNAEIYATGTIADEENFGYKEAWGEYKTEQNAVTGLMRSEAKQSLDAWHYADNYKEQPILGEEWIKEDEKNIDRTLAIKSDEQPQFLSDYWFDLIMERPIPLFNIPGLNRI